jgi:hypothetical protein
MRRCCRQPIRPNLPTFLRVQAERHKLVYAAPAYVGLVARAQPSKHVLTQNQRTHHAWLLPHIQPNTTYVTNQILAWGIRVVSIKFLSSVDRVRASNLGRLLAFELL